MLIEELRSQILIFITFSKAIYIVRQMLTVFSARHLIFKSVTDKAAFILDPMSKHAHSFFGIANNVENAGFHR